MICTSCSKDKDTRPYGRGGAAICFSCAMSSDEGRKTAERQFANQLEGCGPVAVIGESVGPYPMPGTSLEH